jgi:hypothetical protein
MDVKLKEKINEAVDAAIAQWKTSNPVSQDTEPLPQGKEPVPQGTGIESKTLTSRLARSVRNRLKNEAIWGKVQAALAKDALAQIFARKLRPPTRPVDEKQYAFPGFDLLETIRMGRTSVKLPETRVSKFLVFVDGFRARSQRDQQKAEELRRLAEKVRPFADGDPTVADAFKRANSQPSTLAAVPRVG